MRRVSARAGVLTALLAVASAPCAAADNAGATLRIGSKRFTESTILAEILAQTARPYANVEAVPGIGNTAIVYAALRTGSIDCYPEYTGTIELEILHRPQAGSTIAELNQALATKGLAVAVPLGFENRYALGVRGAASEAQAINLTSDLASHPALRGGLDPEFLGRVDGWSGLAARYGLRNPVTGLEHGLAFEALAGGQVDFVDVYSTDAKIERYGIRVLADDKHYFPRYDAVILYRSDLPARFPAAWAALGTLAGRIDERRMIGLNARVEQGEAAERVAHDFLTQAPATATSKPSFLERLFAPDLGRLTRQHLELVLSAVLAATVVGVPLGALAARKRGLAVFVLPAVGLLQTIPALALLAALIPVVGTIGEWPTRIALFLFALLPIVRNTAAGLEQVPQDLRETATSLGARAPARIWFVELPLALPVILAGIRTATVISVGTATIGAFVGAGGYGERITIGLALNDGDMLLAGALPAAALALAFELVFMGLERLLRV